MTGWEPASALFQGAFAATKTCATPRIDRPFPVKTFTSRIAAGAIATALSVSCSARAESTWLTDYKRAQQEAKAKNKLVLLNFTGSDWCGFCIVLDRSIFSQPKFKDYASKNLVLVEVDFPRRKAQNVETVRQNEELAQRYQVQAFPTLVVLDGNGNTVWRYEGLYQGGLTAFLGELGKLHKG